MTRSPSILAPSVVDSGGFKGAETLDTLRERTREQWYQRILHNETAYLIQKRLQWAGLTMVILPAKLR